jgi:hypothetical protein
MGYGSDERKSNTPPSYRSCRSWSRRQYLYIVLCRLSKADSERRRRRAGPYIGACRNDFKSGQRTLQYMLVTYGRLEMRRALVFPGDISGDLADCKVRLAVILQAAVAVERGSSGLRHIVLAAIGARTIISSILAGALGYANVVGLVGTLPRGGAVLLYI